MAHLRRINKHNNNQKQNHKQTLSCGDDSFYYPAPVESPDAKMDLQIQAKQAKKNVA